MNKQKLNQPDVEATTTTCTSCNKYPLKNYKLDQPDVYQYALNSIVKSCCPNCHDNNGCLNCSIKESCNATAKYWVDRLQDLINIHSQPDPTIEEVKKEWEDDGFKWEENEKFIFIFNRIYNFSIDKEKQRFSCFDVIGNGAMAHFITLEQNIRLTKTFRALKWEV